MKCPYCKTETKTNKCPSCKAVIPMVEETKVIADEDKGKSFKKERK